MVHSEYQGVKDGPIGGQDGGKPCGLRKQSGSRITGLEEEERQEVCSKRPEVGVILKLSQNL